MAESEPVLAQAPSYEDLALIEDEFEEIDSEILKRQYSLSKAAYARRQDATSKIPNFWALVFEQAPLEIDSFIQPSDSRIFAESLQRIDVKRFELDDSANTNPSPRSLQIIFHFAPNEDFADTVLEKKLWYRRANDGWTGLVSEPVKIHWKAGKDPTEGLTDAAVTLWEARKKAGNMRLTDGPEYAALKEKVEHWNGANTSFFTWFGWVSGRRWVSAEESEKASKEYAVKMAARRQEKESGENKDKGGGKEEEEEEEEEDDDENEEDEDDSEVEVHETGDDLAISIAEDLWPNAIKFFIQAQEIEEMSDADFEDDDDDAMDDDDEDIPVDIRALVEERNAGSKGKRVSDVAPPAKKQKK